MRQNRSASILVRMSLLLLLLAVAGLATEAKREKYLCQSNALHLFVKATKMEAVKHSASFAPGPTSAVSRIVPPPPEFSATSLVPSEGLTRQRIALAVSFQHRAPPARRAQNDLISN